MKMQGLSQWLFHPEAASAPAATLLIRLAVGGVFFTSGLVKFLYANQGASRFAKLGIPAPALMANFVGVVEIGAGVLVAVGLATRLAAIPLFIDMLVAMGTSKLPLLFGAGPEPVAAAPKVGLWAFAYQSRLDSTMLLSCLFLFAVGAGAWSLDSWRTASSRKSSQGPRQGRFEPKGLPPAGTAVLRRAPAEARRLSRRLPRGS
jgi:uncharacterized membrane protein YphA (DoxX/SURF4 family)